MSESKKVFKDNLIKLVESLNIKSGRDFSRMTRADGRKGIDYTYANKILNSDAPANITFDKADQIAMTLGVDLITLLRPLDDSEISKIVNPDVLPLDEMLLEEAKREVLAVMEELGVDNIGFSVRAEVFYYKSKLEGTPVGAICTKIAKLAKEEGL